MQETPSPYLPIPSSGSGNSFGRQPSYTGAMNDVAPTGASALSAMMRNNGAPPGQSPSSNPHSGFHPGSFAGPLSFSALALGATQPGSSPYSSSMAMSISPPRWQPGSVGGYGSGSFVGSVGQLGTSFGRQAERELEAQYVKDFTCCERQLSGLHELLEHYEEEHANLTPEIRMAAFNNAVQAGSNAAAAKRSFAPPNLSIGHSDVPTTPGMMDMEMEMDEGPTATPATLLHQATMGGMSVNTTPAASPWSAAFRPPSLQPPACVPPSVLSYAPPTPSVPQQQSAQPISIQQQSQSSTPSTPNGSQPKNLTAEQIQARVLKKAQKKAEREAAETGDEEHPGEKRFRCPIEGCGKVYKQANGLKYHLTRSINSGHGNVAAMGGLMALLGEEEK